MNCDSTIACCLNSVASQKYPLIEHILIDGGSSDATLSILNSHKNQLAVVVSEPDHGIYDALNKGIKLSTGDVVGFLHADDLYANDEVLEKLAKIFEDPSVYGVYGDLRYIERNSKDRVVRRWNSSIFNKNSLALGWMPPHPTLYVRRGWYELIGGFDESYKIAADYNSIIKLFRMKSFKAVYLPEILVYMRVGGISNRSLKTILWKSKEDWRVLRINGWSPLGALLTISCKNLRKVPQFMQGLTRLTN